MNSSVNSIGSNLTNILSALQNGVTAASNLNRAIASVTSSNHLQINFSGVVLSSQITSFSTTTGTVTTVNTSIGLTGGPITTTGTVALSITTLTNSLTSNVAISSAGTYADGPTVSQGTSGKFWASGTITCTSTTATNIYAKLWDGTTVIGSANGVVGGSNFRVNIALSGSITNPASNIKISALDADGIPATMEFNRTGNGKDCTITVMRIG